MCVCVWCTKRKSQKQSTLIVFVLFLLIVDDATECLTRVCVCVHKCVCLHVCSLLIFFLFCCFAIWKTLALQSRACWRYTVRKINWYFAPKFDDWCRTPWDKSKMFRKIFPFWAYFGRQLTKKRRLIFIPAIHRVEGYYYFLSNENVYNRQKKAWQTPQTINTYVCIHVHVRLSVRSYKNLVQRL